MSVVESLANTSRKSFATLQDAYDWANRQVTLGVRERLWVVNATTIHADLFRPPRGKAGRYIKLLGVTPRTEREFKKIEPNGEWRLEVVPPGTTYYKAGIFSSQECKTTGYQFTTWYSRFLPYAHAMMMCEEGFDCTGVDFQAINVLYQSCYGFVELGLGDGYDPVANYYRIVKEDCDSFSEIYYASMRQRPPSLPFEEACNPCCCYVAIHDPKLFEKNAHAEHWVRDHVHDVCQDLGIDCPVRRSV